MRSTKTNEEEYSATLLALAEHRASLVRKLLIEEHGVEARRLVDCRAKIKTRHK